MSYREGLGDILAKGCARAVDIIGQDSSYYAMHIKGQDLYEVWRGSLGWCLGTLISPRGGGHTTGGVIDYHPVLSAARKEKARLIFACDNPYMPVQYEGKAQMATYMGVLHRINNCLGICSMHTIQGDGEHSDLSHVAELY